MNFHQTYQAVRQWGVDRKIIPNGTVLGQAKKTMEEAGELRDAALALEAVGAEDATALALLRDGVGDVMVTLVMVCELANLDMEACFLEAYNEIKDRRGQMGEDGIFYKVGATMPDGTVVK